MPSQIIMKEVAAADILTPAIDKKSLFVDAVTGDFAIKDETGAVTTMKGTAGAAGPAGATGAPGTNGTNGVGVPVGGTAGQQLAKIDGVDYNTGWVTPAAGGGVGGGIAGAYDIEKGGSPTYTDLGLSDEMVGATLNAAWTPTTGGSGTVNLVGTVTNPVYDFASRDKGMLVQTGNTAWNDTPPGWFSMRAAAPASGEQIIVSMSLPISPALVVNAYVFRLEVSSTTTILSTPTGGLFTTPYNPLVANIPETGSNQQRSTVGLSWGGREYFRIIHTGGRYYSSHSSDGIAWNPIGSVTDTGVNYVWIIFGTLASWTRVNSGDPIACVNWIRHCAYTGLDPW